MIDCPSGALVLAICVIYFHRSVNEYVLAEEKTIDKTNKRSAQLFGTDNHYVRLKVNAFQSKRFKEKYETNYTHHLVKMKQNSSKNDLRTS